MQTIASRAASIRYNTQLIEPIVLVS